MLRLDLSDNSNPFIVVKRRINVTDTDNTNRRNEKLTFRIMVP